MKLLPVVTSTCGLLSAAAERDITASAIKGG